MSTKLRPLVYIAGPIRKGDLGNNIANAFEAFYALKDAGFAPVCPHLSCFLGSSETYRADPNDWIATREVPNVSFDEWMEIDLSIVAKCDAVLLLPGDSTGAQIETLFASDHGIPVAGLITMGALANAVNGLTAMIENSRSNSLKLSRPVETVAVDRTSILDKAESAINGQRDQDYGSPEDNFGRIAQAWTWYLTNRGFISSGASLDGFDVALMMDLLKTARLINNPQSVDGWVDKVGYAACGGEVACKTAKE